VEHFAATLETSLNLSADLSLNTDITLKTNLKIDYRPYFESLDSLNLTDNHVGWQR